MLTYINYSYVVLIISQYYSCTVEMKKYCKISNTLNLNNNLFIYIFLL